jgi:hypothetical protein
MCYPILQIVAIPVAERVCTPGPKYSMTFPVPPFTVNMPASFKMTSFGEAHPFNGYLMLPQNILVIAQLN